MRPLTLLAAFTLSALLVGPAIAADPYPTAPVRIIVPYPPGGPLDVLMRGLGQKLGEEWKQQILIDNRPGANEAIGADAAAKAKPDGYTLLAATEGALVLNALLFSRLAYNPEKDFTPISQLVEVPMVMVVPARFPAQNVQEFITLAKSRQSNPISYGSSGIGGATHLPLAMMEKDYGLTMTHVPYKGAAPLVQDMIGGQVELAVLAASVVEQHIKSHTLKALAVSAHQRLPSLPDVPTFEELGMKDPNARFMVGLVAPASTPADIVDKISLAVGRLINSSDFKARYLDPYALVPVGSTPAQFKQTLERQRPMQAERVRISGAKLD